MPRTVHCNAAYCIPGVLLLPCSHTPHMYQECDESSGFMTRQQPTEGKVLHPALTGRCFCRKNLPIREMFCFWVLAFTTSYKLITTSYSICSTYSSDIPLRVSPADTLIKCVTRCPMRFLMRCSHRILLAARE